jgi:hypothetical protein
LPSSVQAVDRRHDAGQQTEHHQQWHVEGAQGGKAGCGEGDGGHRELPQPGGEPTGPAVHQRTTGDAEQDPGKGLYRQREAGDRDGVCQSKDQQVLRDHLHPRTGVAEGVGDDPQPHAAAPQGAPGTR